MALKAFIGLGSNLGDRLGNMQRALEVLHGLGARTVRASPVYETDPVGPPQPDFLNAVALLETNLLPPTLLAALKQAEEEVGRQHRERWGPREIDLDILLYEDLEISSGSLRIPHPRLSERAFVLVPLLDLEPQASLPGGVELAGLVIDRSGIRPFPGRLRPPA
ncbi:MAG: 2-amino-4-hydroxy-6-hydroxymethyldihydropteridine diphosphokinase [Actinomycetota bacterium]